MNIDLHTHQWAKRPKTANNRGAMFKPDFRWKSYIGRGFRDAFQLLRGYISLRHVSLEAFLIEVITCVENLWEQYWVAAPPIELWDTKKSTLVKCHFWHIQYFKFWFSKCCNVLVHVCNQAWDRIWEIYKTPNMNSQNSCKLTGPHLFRDIKFVEIIRL